MAFVNEKLTPEHRDVIMSHGEQLSSVDEKHDIDIVYSSSKLKITFINDLKFAGRKLVIPGEALTCGFDAYPASMKWLAPYENEDIDDANRAYIISKILEVKFSTGFKINMNGVENNV